MNYKKKYIKYKTKYLTVKYGGDYEKALEDTGKREKVDIQPLLTPDIIEDFLREINANLIDSGFLGNQNIEEGYIRTVAVKTNAVIEEGNISFLGKLGEQYNEKVIGETCKAESWDNPSYCYFYITLFPEIFEYFSKEIYFTKETTDDELDKMLKSLLGLKSDWGPYTKFVIMDVKKEDLFRPCPNNDINETYCGVDYDENSDYGKWALQYFENSQRNEIPFSGFGYTHNLHPDIKYGLSEYIIKPNSKIIIREIIDTTEFKHRVIVYKEIMENTKIKDLETRRKEQPISGKIKNIYEKSKEVASNTLSNQELVSDTLSNMGFPNFRKIY